MSLKISGINTYKYNSKHACTREKKSQPYVKNPNYVSYGTGLNKKTDLLKSSVRVVSSALVGKVLSDWAIIDNDKSEKDIKTQQQLSDDELVKEIYGMLTFYFNKLSRLKIKPEKSFPSFEHLAKDEKFLKAFEIYKKLISEGTDNKKAFVISNIQNIDKKNIKEISELIDKIGDFSSDNLISLSEAISEFINSKENANLVISDFNKYIDKINLEKLYSIAPQIKNYTPEEKLIFYRHYYQKNITKFDLKTLSLNDSSTKYLSENFLNADELNEFLITKPLIKREVGTFPKGWMENIPTDRLNSTKKIIYRVIENFRQNVSKDPYSIHSDSIKVLELEMRLILDKKVSISSLGAGGFGTGFKISVEGSEDVCLKIFHDKNISKMNSRMHGQHIEPQTGLFVNLHSNDFVKMYFGKVSKYSQKDGFMVTQFLSDEIKPIESDFIVDGYLITSLDIDNKQCGHNKIHGKIIDFGNVLVKKIY